MHYIINELKKFEEYEELIAIIILALCVLAGNIFLITHAIMHEPIVILYYPIAYLLTYLTPWLFNFSKYDDATIKIMARCFIVIIFGGILGLNT